MIFTTVMPERARFGSRIAFAALALATLAVAGLQWRLLAGRLGSIFLPAGSIFSALSLGCALVIAAATVVLRRRGRNRRLTLRFLRRALFPARVLGAASTRTDVAFFVLNLILAGGLIGAAMLSFQFVEQGFEAALAALFGPPGTAGGGAVAAGVQTIVFYLAFELAYYIDHYTSHRFDFFWEIHRVHHTAEVLTPLTLYRVHPIEAIKYHNIAVVITAAATAVAARWLGPVSWTVNGTNILMLGFYLTVNHLQHSQMWIAFTGPLGHVFASPAHHQVHHSDAPEYSGCNLGWSLVVFDWLFGTLVVPSKRRDGLRFGMASGPLDHHTLAGTLVMPVVRAFRTLVPGREPVPVEARLMADAG